MTDPTNLIILDKILSNHEQRMSVINGNHQQVMERLVKSERQNMERHEDRMEEIDQNHAQQMRAIQQSNGGLLGALGALLIPLIGTIAGGPTGGVLGTILNN